MQVDAKVMEESRSIFCPLCRKLFSKTANGEPWSHSPCNAVDVLPPMQPGVEGQDAADDRNEAEINSQTFAEWMQVTKTKLKEYYAAKLRRDLVSQQLIMREIIMAGPKRKVLKTTLDVEDPEDEEEFVKLLEEAEARAKAQAAQAAGPEEVEKSNVERILRIVKHLEKGEISEARRAITQKTGLREATMLGMQQLKRNYFPPARPEALPLPPWRRPWSSPSKRFAHTCSLGWRARLTHGDGMLGGSSRCSTRARTT